MAAVTQFLLAHNGRILHADDHIDNGRGMFLSRLEWDLEGFDIRISDFAKHFNPLAEQYKIKYHLAPTDYRPKVVILVSGYDHCLADLLYRHNAVELDCEVAMIISNHDKASACLRNLRVPLFVSPMESTKGHRFCGLHRGTLWKTVI